MQFKNTIVLAVAALFMAVSCITSDKSVGDSLVPDNQELEIRMAEIPLPVQLKSAQPLQSFSNSESVFGAIRTQEHGLVEFATAANFCPNMSGWDIGKDIQVKEVYFIAGISSTYVPEEEQKGIPQRITLHRINKVIDTNTVFNNSITEADYVPEPLNSTESLYFGGDSIKIHLKNSFAEEIFTATRQEMDTLSLFIERFKGLLLKSSTPDEGVLGGRQNFMNYGAGSIYISVNFQPTWDEGLERKDTLFVLKLGTEVCLNISKYESMQNQTDTPGESMNIEGAAGLKPYISKDDLKQAIDAWKSQEGLDGKNIIIAKGALVFPFEIPEDMDMTNYPASLFPCSRTYDTTYNGNVFYPVSDVNVPGGHTGSINRSLKEYRMDIPSIIQDFVSMDASQMDDLKHNIWIMPTTSQTDSYYGTVSYAIDLSTYYLGTINGPSAQRYPTLQMIYSVMEK